MRKLSLTTQMIVASALGLLAGSVFGPFMENIKFLGEIFLRLMQMSVVFLVMGAIIEAVGALEPRDLGKIGGKAIALFTFTSTLGAIVGLIAVNIIQPGIGVEGVAVSEYKGVLFQGGINELIVNFFPKNIFESMARGDMIQVIIFSAFLGLAISFLGKNESGSKIYGMFHQLNVVIIELIKIVMKFAPIGVFALLAGITGTIGLQVIIPLIKFLITMFIATVVVLVILITIVSIYGKINPIRFIKKLNRTIIVSVTTNSSAIALPVQMEDCENRIGISKRVSRLVNPLAMSLNSNGLALSISIACVTIAQFFGIELTLQEQIVVVVVSTLSTLGNLLVPGGALVAIAIALQMTGLPLEGVAILAGVDWFAGLARTLLNVVGDVLVTFFIAVNEKEFDRSIFDADDVAIAAPKNV
ncbi:dicarboxylate/amino acid:cation symporter [Brevibacillus sp. SYSU BS000544]|uniref:dicarboxylate/amino acid:cation symporter n=1 Tax=Brevibacillus sp. SYSU BS000544 TaxID=3416443 RepID=UPI003CE46F19